MLHIQALRQQAIQQATRLSGWLDQQAMVRRVGVVAALLGAIVLSRQPSLLTLGAVFGGLAAFWLSQRPRLVVPALILIGALAPTTMRAGRDGRINAAMLVVAAFLGAELLRILVRKEVRLRPSPANGPWLFLLILGGLSIVAGKALWNPWVVTKDNFILVQLSQWSLYLLAAGAYFASGTQLEHRPQLLTLVRVVLLLGLLRVALWLGLERFFWSWNIVGGPVTRIWIMAVACAGGLFMADLSRRSRALLLLLAAFTLAWPMLYYRDWASGWLPALACTVAVGFLWVWSRSSRGAVFLYLMATVFTPAAYLIIRGLAADDAWSLDTRLIAFQGLRDLLQGRWILGLGLASYWHYWRDVFGQMSYIDPQTGYFHYTFNPTVNTHNQYLDVLAQMGLVGQAVFVWLLMALAWQALRCFRAEGPGFGRAYAAACVGGIVGMSVSGFLGDWIIPFVYNIGLNGFRDSFIAWLMLGGVTLLDATRTQQEAPAPDLATSLPLPHPPAPPRAPA